VSHRSTEEEEEEEEEREAEVRSGYAVSDSRLTSSLVNFSLTAHCLK
jgi:hypothetical protein